MFDLYVFDLDGTLVDTLPETYAAFASVCRTLHLTEPSREAIARAFGRGLQALVATLFESTDPDKVSLIYEAVRAHYEKNNFENTLPFPHVVETLATLSKKTPCVVLTNKATTIAERIIRKNFGDTVSDVFGEGTVPRLKPDPAGLLFVREKYAAKNPLFVGDSRIDKETAERASVPFCAVTFGHGSATDVAGADFYINNFAELLNI